MTDRNTDAYQLRRVAQLVGRDGRTLAQLLHVELDMPAPLQPRESRPAGPDEFLRCRRRDGHRYPSL